MHKEFPTTQHLDIHIEGDRLAYFDDDDDSSEGVVNEELSESTLTSWFKHNSSHPDDLEARITIYHNLCERHTFYKQQNPRVWSTRRSNIEKFHLRILLYHIPGATSFVDLQTYNGEVYPSYQVTARAMGLFGDDNESSATITEASSYTCILAINVNCSVFCLFPVMYLIHINYGRIIDLIKQKTIWTKNRKK